ncbi:MAG: peroxiredoxin [Patescibacteria group bacterium]
MFKIDSPFPGFRLEAYDPKKEGETEIANADFKGKWLILFFYPADFTFVCPTEIADMHRRLDDFRKLKTEVVVASTDTVYTHRAWIEVEELLKGLKYLMAADHSGKFSRELDIYDENSGMARRAAFIIDPDGILRAADVVSDPIGRSAGEIVRKLKALQFVRAHPGKVCPASWEEGDEVIVKSIKKAGHMYEELEK